MQIHRSNRTEQLVEVLARVASEPGPRPFEPEWIGVQGRGMERWITLELARRIGIWANPRFLFPRELIDAVLDLAQGAAGLRAAYTPDTLQWTIARLLAGDLAGAHFAPLRRYLEGEPGEASPLRASELARRIAETFDHYTVYRPDLLLAWEAGEAAGGAGEGEDGWQPELWRRVVAHHGGDHGPARVARLQREGVRGEKEWPSRVHVFGATTLPPLHLDVLAALSKHTELHLYLLAPTREYYADTRSARELARDGALAAEAEDQHWDEGHPLVASLGRLGREFQSLIEERLPYLESDTDLFRTPRSGDAPALLPTLQGDLLALSPRQPGSVERPPLPLSDGDASIRIHSCHGPLREVEVLHDQLLAAFEEEPELAPHDVIVMAPDIEAYAPYIEAVFGGGEGGGPRIPFRIADRSPRRSLEGVEAFCRWLGLLPGRLRAGEVMDLLAFAAVRDRYGIDESELDRLRQWVGDAGVRWGASASHREANGLPGEEQHTWRLGLDRMLVGLAMDEEAGLFGGLLPHAVAEGQDAVLLGRFGQYIEDLLNARRALLAPQGLDGWRAVLHRWIDRVLSDDAAFDRQVLREQLSEIAETARSAGFDGPVPLEVMRSELERRVGVKTPGHDFLSGTVTFCEMVPMRSIPFAVVALLGLSDDQFPRRTRAVDFDESARHPRRGDRSPREDDRQLFLEALLSARRRFLVSYVGQNAMDNGTLPPSVVVSELIDALEEAFVVEGVVEVVVEGGVEGSGASDPAPSVRERIVCRHPLQPFSPRAFAAGGDARLHSFDRGSLAAARAFAAEPRDRAAFLPADAADAAYQPEAIAAPGSADGTGREDETIELDAFLGFFGNPARAFCQRRLRLHLGNDLEWFDDRELVALDGLERWGVGQFVLERVLAGDGRAAALERARVRGLVPLGAPGRLFERELWSDLEPIVAAGEALRSGDPLPGIEIDQEIAGARIRGRIDSLWPAGRCVLQFARLGNRSELSLWIQHLLWCASRDDAGESWLVGQPSKDANGRRVRLAPMGNALAALEPLVEVYQQGLARPIPLHPHAARAYMERVLCLTDARDRAIVRGRKRYEGSYGPSAEASDPYEKQLYGDLPGYVDETFRDDDSEFAHLAQTVYGPFLQHRELLP